MIRPRLDGELITERYRETRISIWTLRCWTNSYLHQFEIARMEYGEPDEEWPELVVVDDRRVTVSTALGVSVTPFRYQYDFSDGWEPVLSKN